MSKLVYDLPLNDADLKRSIESSKKRFAKKLFFSQKRNLLRIASYPDNSRINIA